MNWNQHLTTLTTGNRTNPSLCAYLMLKVHQENISRELQQIPNVTGKYFCVFIQGNLKNLCAFSYQYQDEKAVLSHRPPFLHEYTNIIQENLDYDFKEQLTILIVLFLHFPCLLPVLHNSWVAFSCMKNQFLCSRVTAQVRFTVNIYLWDVGHAFSACCCEDISKVRVCLFCLRQPLRTNSSKRPLTQ